MSRDFFNTNSTFTNDKLALERLNHFQQVHFAVHTAKSVLHIWEQEFPDDHRPRLALEAALTFDPEKPNAAWAAANAAANAADAVADAAAYAAAYAAAHAAWTASAADTAAYAAYAANAAANAAADPAARVQKWDWIYSLYQAIYRDGRVFPSQWKTPTVLSLQQVAQTDLSVFPILADALEDAGCDDQEILCHLRQRSDLWTPADWVLIGK